MQTGWAQDIIRDEALDEFDDVAEATEWVAKWATTSRRLWLTWLQAKTSSEKVASRQRKRLRLLAIPLPVAGLILAVLVPGRSFILAGEGGMPATARAAGGGYPIPPCPKWALGNPELPSPRARAFVAFDPALGQLVLYGGQPALCQVTKSLRRNLNETWLWDGHRWLSTDPQGSPVDSPVEGGMVLTLAFMKW